MFLSKEFPEFLNKYLSIPILVRLKNVGLLCGTDWTPFFSNNIFYSRFEHSIGVALIIWNFTKDKAQTIAGLLHDVSTPAFSHVQDFRKGDSLTQTETEKDNFSILKSSAELLECLKQDGLSLIPLSVYFKKGRAKVKVGLCKGKKLYDKRDAAARKDAARNIERAMKERLQ